MPFMETGNWPIKAIRKLVHRRMAARTSASATFISEHHIWPVEQVQALVANRDEAVTFFCGGSMNFSKFVDVFDGVFILEVDFDTMNGRIAERVAVDPTDWGGTRAEREVTARMYQAKEGIPSSGVTIDATQPLEQVVDEIFSKRREAD